MKGRFKFNIVMEHGYLHYKIVDTKDGSEIHCDLNELNETIDELVEQILSERN